MRGAFVSGPQSYDNRLHGLHIRSSLSLGLLDNIWAASLLLSVFNSSCPFSAQHFRFPSSPFVNHSVLNLRSVRSTALVIRCLSYCFRLCYYCLLLTNKHMSNSLLQYLFTLLHRLSTIAKVHLVQCSKTCLNN